MKEKSQKNSVVVLFNILLFLFNFCLYALLVSGNAYIEEITLTSTTIWLITVGAIWLYKRKKGKIVIRKAVVVIFTAIFTFTVSIVPLSSGYRLLGLYNRFNCTSRTQVLEKELEKNTYLEVCKNDDGRFYCNVVKKTLLTYHIVSTEYYWDSADFKQGEIARPFSVPMPKITSFNSALTDYILYAALPCDSEYKAYADGIEMNIISADGMKLAYLVVEDEADNNYKYDFKLNDLNGNTLYEIRV